MPDYTTMLRADTGQPAIALQLIAEADFVGWLKTCTARHRAAVEAARFAAKPGEWVILPGEDSADWSAALGCADAAALGPWDLAGAAERLPEGTYRVAAPYAPEALLGWLLAQYRFAAYRTESDARGPRVLLTPHVAQMPDLCAQAAATARVRDMVNTPAADMGPADIEAEVVTVAQAHGAACTVTKGDASAQGYPLIAAVGRAAPPAYAPRLIELTWGNPKHPRIAVIGKGVSFDTGGLNLKTGGYMRLMKKDMGGAAHALALADLIMRARLPVRLHMLIPTAENAIGGAAFRPGDILKSRAGLTVEIENTDAEGRLLLADALTRAGEEAPTLILDFATLTGAARVALGPDLPALFASDDALSTAFAAASRAVHDPVWPMPLWDGYADMLKSDIADLANASESGMAGAVTAALFLKRFVPPGTPWAHLDTFAWRPAARPGRPKGGEALGLRAAYALLRARFPTP